MANERLFQFPSKASPVPADIIYVGDSADAFNEVQSTIAQIIAAYPNLSGIGGLTMGNNTYAYKNNSGTWVAGTITAYGVTLLASLVTANNSVLVTDGTGVPSLSQTLPTAVQANITQLGAQSQALNMNSHLISNVTDPVSAQDVATRAYVDAAVQGLTIQGACYAATTANLTATYANGSSGIGATLTNSGALAAFSVDGVSPPLNSRILVKNQSSTLENGIYKLTTVGSGAVAWVLTRATDYDQPAEINPGDLVIIDNGTANANSSWVQTATVSAIGTDPITFSQFTGQAASKAVSDNTKSTVASVTGSFTTGNLIKSNDTTGTSADSGLPSTSTGTGDIVRATAPTVTNLTSDKITFSNTTQGVVGTTTNNDAASGYVGEYQSSIVLIGSAVSLTSSTPANVTSLSLSAGDWDVWGEIWMNPAGGTVTSFTLCSITTTSATSTSAPADNSATTQIYQSSTGNNVMPLAPCRMSLSGTTTIYLVVNCNFSVSTNAAYGKLAARRVR